MALTSASTLRVASLVLGLAAVSLFWLAFTQFDQDARPSAGAAGASDYDRDMTWDAQRSVGLGLAGCFVLLGSFACHARAASAGARPPAATEPPGPQP